ncbi:nitrilase-related carbon-nitrogen hydrolase [Saccharopolyspora phatthalungensis]|uniref:nitrilase-related carbon-nitrogen hydrolase n=1 Tax=Saccharopolyspora phatthalungensis TaxID=664693 RepID=UPI001613BC49|nr:nitrilase-related carbon-nitrogen hydrolase [Saccharopolyspora phatthalungensis]
MANEAFTAASVQFEPTLFDKDRNISRLLDLVEQAAHAGAKLVTTPEMATTGYCFFDEAEAERMAEPIPGSTVDRFAALASAHGIHVVLGMPERDVDSGLLYNAAVLIGPDGVIGTHRKSHSYIAEPKWAAPGNHGHQVFDTAVGRIAVLICMDLHFIETGRLVGLEGADVICHLSNWLAERTPAPYWISRAYENASYLIESNRWGLERGVQFSGGSCVIGPDATILASRDSGDGLVFATIDPAAARAAKRAADSSLSRRRPELYRELQKNTYLWNPLEFFPLYGRSPLPPGRESVVTVVQEKFTATPAHNAAKIIEYADKVHARDRGELIVFPELALSGGAAAGGQLRSLARESARQVDLLLGACARLGVWMLVGMYESDEDDDRVHNTLFLLGPGGVAARHRKVHLAETESAVAAGDVFTTVDTPFGRVGIAHGDDIWQPETGRILALRGCDLVVAGADLQHRMTQGHDGSTIEHGYPIPHGADPVHWHHIRVRAGENNVYLAFANTPAVGASGIFGPDTFAFPRIERMAGRDSTWVSMVVDTRDGGGRYPATTVRRKDLVSMRLPHHYGALSAPTPTEAPRTGDVEERDVASHDSGKERQSLDVG